MSEANGNNRHATAVCFGSAAVLIFGASGSGKSDLALRLIEHHKARLVADDQVILTREDDKLLVSAPKNIEGLLEVRGIGIVRMPFERTAEAVLAVRLVDDLRRPERMPPPRFENIEGINLSVLELYPFEVSAADKVVIKLKAMLDKTQKKS